MTKRLTKSQRTNLARTVVSSLQETMDFFYDYLGKTSGTTILNMPKGTIKADGSSELDFTQSPHAARSQSQHQKIAEIIFMKEANQIFRKAADALAELLPGQPLVWVTEPNRNSRHRLFLGDSENDCPSVIYTVLTRWITPLVRLSNYLDEVDVGDGTQHTWCLFSNNEYMTNKDKHTIGQYRRTYGRSIDEAVRLLGFDKTYLSLSTPTHSPFEFALRLGQRYSHANFQEYLRTIPDISTKTDVDSFLSNKSTYIDPLEKAIFKMQTISDFNIEIDLVKGSYQISESSSPFVAAPDLTYKDSIKSTLDASLKKFVDALHHTLLSIHPSAYQAEMTLQCFCDRSSEHQSPRFLTKIDGKVTIISLYSMECFLNFAAAMSHCVRRGPFRLYTLEYEHEENKNTMKKDRGASFVKATSFPHAALIFSDDFYGNSIIREAIPVEYDEIQQALATRKSAISVYDNA